MCSSCDEYSVEIEILGPAQLRRIIGKLQAAVEARVLVIDPCRSGNVAAEQPESLALKGSGPTPDVLAYEFSCATRGQRFERECETNHGAGGHWARV